MDALIPAFVLGAACEMGDRTQALAAALGDRYRRPVAIVAGIGVAAAVNMGIAGAGGGALTQAAPHSALLLLTALALLFAGVGAFLPAKPAPALDGWRLGAFASSCGSFLILAFGDKTQFIMAALAGTSGQPVQTAIGATAGIVLANAPAAVLGDQWPRLVPLRALRAGVGGVLTLAALVLAASALRIV